MQTLKLPTLVWERKSDHYVAYQGYITLYIHIVDYEYVAYAALLGVTLFQVKSRGLEDIDTFKVRVAETLAERLHTLIYTSPSGVS